MILKKANSRYLFILLLILISWYYHYPQILLKKPQSVHNWRQSDCASITLNYYQNGMKFFQPEIHGLISDHLTSGKAATSEIPFLYFGIALLYKIFGYHDFIYRLVNTLIFLFGVYSLFQILIKLKVNLIWSITLSLLFFASPVLVFYGNNYLSDITALSFSIVAWNYFFSYFQTGQKKQYILSMIFLFLGMSLKISAGISIITLLGIFFAERTGIINFKVKGKIFPGRMLQLIPFVLILLIVGGWAFYAKEYNIRHYCNYFSTTVFPIWSMSHAEIVTDLNGIKVLWLNQYFDQSTLIFFLFIFILNLIHIKKANKLLITSNILMFIGFVLYVLLWFRTFQNHDYYTINMYILLIMTILVFAEYMNRLYPKLSGHFLIKSLLVCFLVFNIWHTQKEMNMRYNGWWNEYPEFRDFDEVTPYLRSIGISRFDRVISIPDQSHHTLYIMNQPGWTQCYNLNMDSVSVQQSIDRGARYLIVASAEELNKRPYLTSFIKDLAGNYGTVLIYKLQ
jgi:hypothetical protein